MTKLVMHIGPHKTASTSIQKIMRQTSEFHKSVQQKAATNGSPNTCFNSEYFYPPSSLQFSGHADIAWAFNLERYSEIKNNLYLPSGIEAPPHEKLYNDVVERLSRYTVVRDRLLFSSEEFCFWKEKNVSEFLDVVKPSHIELHSISRDPEEVLLSAYKTAVCASFYARPFAEFAEYNAPIFDISEQIKVWQQASKDAHRQHFIWRFDRSRSGNFFKQFCKYLNLRFDPADVVHENEIKFELDRLELLVNLKIINQCQSAMSPSELVEITNSIFDKIKGEEYKQPLLPKGVKKYLKKQNDKLLEQLKTDQSLKAMLF